MHLRDGQVIFSPTDLTRHLACPHLTTLDLAALGSQRAAPPPDEALELVFRMGLAHEAGFLDGLRAQGRSVVEIEDPRGPGSREAATVAAMRSGVDVVYQGVLDGDGWTGRPDFLLRVETPSLLGEWSYEIADTKLARRLKVPALLQMASYAERLTTLQGKAPERLLVVTGDDAVHGWRLVDVAAYARRARQRLEAAVAEAALTESVPVAHCAQCSWAAHCAQEWADADDLSLVAFMRAGHRHALRTAGVSTLAALAGLAPDQPLGGIGRESFRRLVQQAMLQLSERQSGRPSYVLLPPERGTGLLRLPAPSAGDVYLDFEGDPYAEGGRGREYLAGLSGRDGSFEALWAHDWEEERELTRRLVHRLLELCRASPEAHVYHYAPYEVVALQRLAQQHGVAEAELDQLLRGERFVDLYAVVRQGLRISKPSYSIKQLEHFYWQHTRDKSGDVADAMASVVAYERWLVERDDTTLTQIECYNRDDVLSTLALHDWLEERRAELEAEHAPQPRPTTVVPEPPGDDEQAELELVERLQAVGQHLLAGMVQFHRREARPGWWDVFRLQTLDEDELIEDGTPLGALGEPRLVGTDKRSNLYEYAFPPQDTKISVGDQVMGVDDQVKAGAVFALDAPGGRIVLKKAGDPIVVRGLGPPGPFVDTAQRLAIRNLAEEVLAGRPGLGDALLRRRVPPGTALLPGEVPSDAVTRVGMTLQGTVLAVQGPPGSGKTTAAAALIRALLDSGKTVGVTANSHAVVGNLLRAVGRPALQKCLTDQHCGSGLVAQATSNQAVATALSAGTASLVGGTSWLWSAPDLRDAVDVLVIDEAGQFALANAVAVTQAAGSLVLLGDPQQLAAPTRALHPDGAGESALGHLLEGHETIPRDRGIFLNRSWRMHPDITAYVSDLAYEGRLASAPGRERQQVLPGGLVEGSGLRVMPVDHGGNAAASSEEAEVVRRLWVSLQGQRWVDQEGASHLIGPEQVLVVAPYNNQVGRIRSLLPAGARVGTVDKFQGAEAPVVLYSMTSSSAADAPRGVGFLYDLHRLNVAVSRAQALAVVVLSPALLDAEVRTPLQLRQVNALCRLAEGAQHVALE